MQLWKNSHPFSMETERLRPKPSQNLRQRPKQYSKKTDKNKPIKAFFGKARRRTEGSFFELFCVLKIILIDVKIELYVIYT